MMVALGIALFMLWVLVSAILFIGVVATAFFAGYDHGKAGGDPETDQLSAWWGAH